MPSTIAILLVLFASLQNAGQENDQPQSGNENANTQAQVSEADNAETSDPAVVEITDASKNDNKDHGEMANADVQQGDKQDVIHVLDPTTESWKAPSNLIAVAGALLLAWVVLLTRRTTKIAAEANQQAAHSSEQQLRPWIFLKPTTDWGIKWDERGLRFTVVIECDNRGKTPALEVVAKCHLEKDENLRSDEFDRFSAEHRNKKIGCGCLAIYHHNTKKINYHIELSRDAIERRKWNWGNDDNQPFYMNLTVYISVIYRSIYDDVVKYQTAHVFQIEWYEGPESEFSPRLLVDKDLLVEDVRFEQAGSYSTIT